MSAVRHRCRGAAVAILAAALLATGCSGSESRYEVVGTAQPRAPHTPDATADLPGAETLARESGALTDVPMPAFGYVAGDQTGEYVNVKDAERRSWQAPAVADSDPEVWFFGGSALFGYGTQRDEYTVPSAYARAAHAAGTRLRVRNFSAPGHTNFVETEELAGLLSSGRRPKLVVFLDGYNDSLLAAGNRMIGSPQAGQQSNSQWDRLIGLAQQSPDWHGPKSGFVLGPPKGSPQPATDEVAGVITRLYAQGVDLAAHLADAYGFDVVNAWQPDLYSKRLVGDEQAVRESWGVDDELADHWRTVMELVRSRLPEAVLDLTTVFDDVPRPIMADMMHFNEEGASLIADRLWERTRDQVQAN